MRKYKKKNKFGLLVLLLAIVSIGFALLNSNLKIVGHSGINGNIWDIHWDSESIQVTSGSVLGTTSVNDDNDTLSYTAELSLPGDYYEFTIDAVNAGTVDGMLNIEDVLPIVKNESGQVIDFPEYINYYLTYADDIEIEKDHILKKRIDKNTPTREKYKVRIEIDDNLTTPPGDDSTIEVENEIPYKQIDDTGKERSKKYTITFDYQNGQENTTKEVVTKEKYGTLPKATKEGYIFQGWYLNDQKITSDDIVTITKDETLYARYKLADYSISYTLNGGNNSSENPTGYDTESANIELVAPTKDGYTFIGWTGSNGTTPEVNVVIPSGETGNKNYIANWSANTYNISYEINGGTNQNNPTSAEYDSVVEINNPTKTYTLNIDSNSTGATIKNSNNEIINSITTTQKFKGWKATNLGSNAKTGTTTNPNTSWNGNTTKNKYFKNLVESGEVMLTANWTVDDITLPTIEKEGSICGFSTEIDGIIEYSSGDLFTPSKELNTETLYARCGKAEFANGDKFNYRVKILSGTLYKNSPNTFMVETPYVFEDNKITLIEHSNTIDKKYKTDDNLISDETSVVPIYAWYENNKIYWWSEDSKPYLNEDSGAIFANLNSLSSVSLNDYDLSKLKKIDYMFGKCTSLTTIDVSPLNTNNITKMAGLFAGCSSLVSLNLSGFNTSDVTDMFAMFAGCSSLASLDLSSFNTSNVITMEDMFYNCTNLVNLNLSSFNTSNVKYMNSMFAYCDSITTLDLTSFDTSKVENFGYRHSGSGSYGHYSIYRNRDQENGVFAEDTNLKTIYASKKFVTTSDTTPLNDSRVFYKSTKLVGGSGTTYSSSHIGKDYARIDRGSNYPGYFTVKDAAILDTGSNVRDKFIDIAGGQQNIEEIRYANTTNANMEQLPTTTSSVPVYAWYQDGVIYINSDSGIIYLNADSSNLFQGFFNMTNVDLEAFDTSKVTNMYYMFAGCGKLTSLDLSGFDTSNVTNMSSMFTSCSSLTSLDLSMFDVSNVSNFSGIFSSCSNIKSINVSNWHLDSITSLDSFFSGISGVETITMNNFGTSNITSMNAVFYGLNKITTLDLSSWDTSNVTLMQAMFNGCTSLKTIYASDSFVTTKIVAAGYMFGGMSTNLKGGSTTTWSSSNPTDHTYAHIDGGYSNPGYFTYKASTINNTSSRNMKYTVNFDSNGGSVDPVSIKVSITNSIETLPTPTKEGYKFQGWFTGLTDGVKVDDSYIPTSNTTLYARWIEE